MGGIPGADRERPFRRSAVEKLLLRISAAVGSGQSLAEILQVIIMESMQATGAQEGSVLLNTVGSSRLDMLASRGLPDEVVQRGYINRSGSIAAWVIEHNTALILNGGAVQTPHFKTVRTAQPQRHIVSAMCLPLRAEGGVIGVLNLNRTNPERGVFRPVDQRVMTLVAAHAAESIRIAQLHQAVLQSERLAAIGQTVSGVAHCIKNLLSSLTGGQFICNRAVQERDFDTYEKGSALLNQAVGRISTLTLDMLEFSVTRKCKAEKVSLRKLFNELVALQAERAQASKVKIILLGLDAEDIFVESDAGQLFRCLLNLLDNAIQASPAGGKVALSAALDRSSSALRRLGVPSDCAVLLQVSDQGTGVPEDVEKRIFDPFFSTKGSGGTGLGLAVARKIARENFGELELAEKSPAGGATFALYLPLRRSS